MIEISGRCSSGRRGQADPANLKVLNNLGALLLSDKDFAAAHARFAAAASLLDSARQRGGDDSGGQAPGTARELGGDAIQAAVLKNLGQAAVGLARHAEAAEALSGALVLDPLFAEAHAHRGVAHHRCVTAH
jgi:Tfp pilus assembly protein PilF